MNSRLPIVLCGALTLILACTTPTAPAPTPEVRGPRPPGSGLLFDEAKLTAPSGETAMEFVVKEDDIVTLYRDGGERIASYTVAKDRIVISTVRGVTNGAIVRGPDAFTLTTSNPQTTTIELSREPDGDLRIDRAGERLFDLKHRDYGYKVVDARGVDLGRVRTGSTSIKIRDQNRVIVRETKAPISTAAVACWVLPHLELYEAGALTLAVTVWGLPD
ncbi:MAG: hypothetical protein VX681_10705 [Myxococcota bacterium]|nr:hypothetical protein [Myxococcota bacterium]